MNFEAELNLDKIKSRFEEIEDTLLGLKAPVTEYICDRYGNVTDEKIRELAERVIWRECNLYGKNIGIFGDRKRYYELLFYLILRAYDPQNIIQNFSDLLVAAKQLADGFRCYEELILCDAGLLRGQLQFHQMISDSCNLLTGRSVSDDFTKTELDQMKQDYERKRKMWESKNKELKQIFVPDREEREKICEKYRDYGEEGIDSYEDALDNEYFYKFGSYYLDELSEKYYETFDEYGNSRPLQEEPEKTEQAKVKDWVATFDEPRKYLDAYREFCELNFFVDVMSGEQNLKTSLLDVLAEDGFNKLGNDRFTRIYAELNRILRMARSRIG